MINGNVQAVYILTRTLMKGLVDAAPPGVARDLLMVSYDAQFRQEAPAIANGGVMQQRFLYRTVSDEELSEYVRFLSTVSGRTFSKATWTAVHKLLEESGTEIGRRMVSLFFKAGGLQ
jgi:hypothetical protein